MNFSRQPLDFDHTQFVSTACNQFVRIFRFKLKRDQWAIGVDYLRATLNLCPRRSWCRVLDIDYNADSALAWFEKR